MARELLNALTSMRSDLGLFFENPPGLRETGLRSAVYMVAVAVVGLAAFFGPIAVALLILGIVTLIAGGLGVRQDGLYWLYFPIAMAGFCGGLAAASTVMYRITRRHSTLAEIAGFNEKTEAIEEGGQSSDFERNVAEPEVDPAWLRKVDARLAAPKPRKDSRR